MSSGRIVRRRYPTAPEYLASVYRDERLLRLSHATASAMISNLSWVWHAGVPLLKLRCKSTFKSWRPGTGSVAATTIALLHAKPNLVWRMSQYGVWLASGLPAPLQLMGTGHPAGPSEGVPWRHRGFVADGTWAEVLRLAPTWTVGEGGHFGCWFEMSKGSGIAVQVGRSLRAINRSSLAAQLRINVTQTFERPADGRKGRKHLWQVWSMHGMHFRPAGFDLRDSTCGIRPAGWYLRQVMREQMRSNASRAWSRAWPPPLFSGIGIDDEVRWLGMGMGLG
jgi:hypothetical protein